ncbi:hypothetical protein Salat_1613800 [Sesamum alatum]|uniref:Uncharacterized protein n=1 Tax=Sesamum alatum TaxID=300844 RepID=A0AAE2CJG7_9LAMI|nr:hypothetical protein Salat_1613800 [Sesamum alatum]
MYGDLSSILCDILVDLPRYPRRFTMHSLVDLSRGICVRMSPNNFIPSPYDVFGPQSVSTWIFLPGGLVYFESFVYSWDLVFSSCILAEDYFRGTCLVHILDDLVFMRPGIVFMRPHVLTKDHFRGTGFTLFDSLVSSAWLPRIFSRSLVHMPCPYAS